MTTPQLEEAICHQYDNGRYSPCGADGGALKYIRVNVYGKTYSVSITLDHDIAQIRRIWDLKEVLDANHNMREIFDYTKEYYKVSKAGV